jgi:hypothetical protein
MWTDGSTGYYAHGSFWETDDAKLDLHQKSAGGKELGFG